MKPIFYDFQLGDRKEETVVFRQQDVGIFRQIVGRPSGVWANEAGTAVEPQLLASRALCVISGLFGGIPLVPIQQEVIFFDTVSTNEELNLKTEVISIEQSRGWITFSLQAINTGGNAVMAGQVVMAFTELGAAGKNA